MHSSLPKHASSPDEPCYARHDGSYKYVIVVTNEEGAILSPRQHKAVRLTVQHLGTQCSSCQEHFFATKWSKLFRKIASKRKMIACEAAVLMYLQAEFGKYGKILWSRSEEERARKRNCGFVSFYVTQTMLALIWITRKCVKLDFL
ncbi:hypothetical protein PsorP6_012236 [Peronosclerospora sorghi]|uniref:Uncharacterized protein n=1 Tax=Peronosclerospora sorghi TaxID=230839 RepID=A0ACC0WKG0_9STRA|nr:hypothetical protein PsorP6_012236 [Peronosclerospora sorghi]